MKSIDTEYREYIEKLEQQIKELEGSRKTWNMTADHWRSRHKEAEQQITELEERNARLLKLIPQPPI